MDWETLTGPAGAVRSFLRHVTHSLRTTPAPQAGTVEPLALETGELSESAIDTRVTVMAVDPHQVHVYWTVAAARLQAAIAALGEDEPEPQAILRFHDITGIDFDGVRGNSSFDVEVYLPARKSYVQLWSPEKRYCVDLGLRKADGEFITLARSNTVETPPVWPQAAVRDAELTVEATAEVTAPHPPAPTVPAPDSREVLARKLEFIAAIGGHPLRDPREPEPSRLPASAAASGAAADLTALSEERFTTGLSSDELQEPRSGH